ncbi:hypothetical protein DESC_810101 [Desulfosarcina cetonica]|nr:hypothetical protein DESC_500068 [Desulfosarcina cetonica]VTR70530.1 hypothetical protein DESC_810101 [Desulfosarcina cetonica]
MTVIKKTKGVDADDNTLLQYESLRLQVLNRQGNFYERSMGLALFISKGMVAWIEACHRCIPVQANRQKRSATQSLTYQATSEMIKVMANITLFNLQEVPS